jgi:coenzyme F420-reducing hydrogenase delta subunit
MGACPSSTPFRRSGDLVTGIDLPAYSLTDLRAQVIEAAAALSGPGRVLTLACSHGAGGPPEAGRIVLPCVAMAPPSLLDFIISRDLADGVCIAGCAERECWNRLGGEWMRERVARRRDPFLRERVPRERLLVVWAGPSEGARLRRETAAFAAQLAAQPSYDKVRPLSRDEAAKSRAAASQREIAE